MVFFVKAGFRQGVSIVSSYTAASIFYWLSFIKLANFSGSLCSIIFPFLFFHFPKSFGFCLVSDIFRFKFINYFHGFFPSEYRLSLTYFDSIRWLRASGGTARLIRVLNLMLSIFYSRLRTGQKDGDFYLV